MRDIRTLSNTMSYWLRHNPAAAGLVLDREGWAETEAVLSAFSRKGMAVDQALLARVAAENDKARFEYSLDGRFIRARQGHSIAVDLGWPAADPPVHLFHGTVERFLEPILSEGLKPRSRHHVHLSPDEETARKVGARRGKPVILRIDAARMAGEGHVFYLSGNGVWLTDHVPPGFMGTL